MQTANLDSVPGRRPAFTLVEMLVVLAVLLILATLTVAFMPRFNERQRAAEGATRLQGWLVVARQWALRDKAPRGIRLVADSANRVTTLQYIEQPNDFTGGLVNVTWAGTAGTASNGYTGNYNTSNIANGDFTGHFGPGSDMNNWAVQVGDYFEISNHIFRITGITPSTTTPQQGTFALYGDTQSAPVSYPAAGSTGDYRVIRHARPKAGESPLELPANVAVDVNTNGWYSNPLTVNAFPANTYDILFNPSGTVVINGSNADKIQLWVRDISQDSNGHTFVGEQVLVTVFTRTGLIAAQPVDITPAQPGDPTYSASVPSYKNPYSFTLYGRSSGY